MTPEDSLPRSYWDGLTVDECSTLTRVGRRMTFPGGRTLLAQHDATRDVIIILSGLTKVATRLGGGRPVVLAVRGPGDIVGEMAHLNGGRRSAMVAAINDVMALRVARLHFSGFLSGSTHASELLRSIVVDRLREADRDRVAAASMTVGQRLARLLLVFARRYGVPDSAGGLIINLFSQDDLAACVGGARGTVTRQIARWRHRGIVSTTRMSVTVHQPDALARMVGPGRMAG